MLLVAGLQKPFWEEAVSTACYLQNRTYTTALRECTPYERWFGHTPDLCHLKVFGCPAYAFIPDSKRKKLDPKALKSLFMGYGEQHGIKAYRMWDPSSRIFFYSRSADFDEGMLLHGHTSPVEQASSSNNTSSNHYSRSSNTPFEGKSFASAPKLHDNSSITWEEPAYPSPYAIVKYKNPLHDASTYSGTPISHDKTHDDIRSTQPTPSSENSLIDCSDPLISSPDSLVSASSSPHPTSSHLSPAGDESSPSSLPSSLGRTRSLADIYASTANLPLDAGPGPAEDPPPLSTADRMLLHLAARKKEPTTLPEPLEEIPTIAEALQGPEADRWREAMDSELTSLLQNNTWTLAELPPDRKAVTCKWLLRKKFNPDGTVARYKAHLVARGFSQTPGLDFNETFSSVLPLASLRILLALAAHYNFHVHQMDVETAFLHGDLTEEIYMQQPPSYESREYPSKLCKLNKSIYGLKQSPRQWYQKFNAFMLAHGYTKFSCDANVYLRTGADSCLLVAIYVDDIILESGSLDAIHVAKLEFSTAFSMTDIGELKYILGIQVQHDRDNGIMRLSQRRYADLLLQHFQMDSCRGIDTPLPVNNRLSAITGPESLSEQRMMADIPYSNAIGGVRYLVTGTRFDICYAANFLSRYMQHPALAHWRQVKRLFRYINHTKMLSLVYTRSTSLVPPILGWTDADWGGDINTKRSTSGYAFTLAGGAVAWQSKLQKSVAQSSTEAEYMALSTAAKGGIWIRRFLQETRFSQVNLFTLYCDNKSAILMTQQQKQSERTKHIDFKKYFVQDLVEEQSCEIIHTSTEDQ
ncbi:hypothetical protein L7F22_063815 [Adiantum nelumboides]|nr:hypothetical protein [Adiantum nelumboides]